MLTQGTSQKKKKERRWGDGVGVGGGGALCSTEVPSLPFAKPGCRQHLHAPPAHLGSKSVRSPAETKRFSLLVWSSGDTIYGLQGEAWEIWKHPARKKVAVVHPWASRGTLCGCVEGRGSWKLTFYQAKLLADNGTYVGLFVLLGLL